MMTLLGLKNKIRDKVQEYSSSWLTDDMLVDLINYSVKNIATLTLVFKKLYNVAIVDTNLVPLPSNFYNSIHVKIGDTEYPKANYEDIEYLGDSKYHYIIDNVLYLSDDTSGTVEILYNYIPTELANDVDELDSNFIGFENVIVYQVVSEIFGMDGDIERQAFYYRIFEQHLRMFKLSKTNTDNGRPVIKTINYKRYWGSL